MRGQPKHALKVLNKILSSIPNWTGSQWGWPDRTCRWEMDSREVPVIYSKAFWAGLVSAIQVFQASMQQNLWYQKKAWKKLLMNQLQSYIPLPLWIVYMKTEPVLSDCILNPIFLLPLCQNRCFQVESYLQVLLAPFMELCEVSLTLQQDYKGHVSLCDDTIVCLSESLLYLILPLCAI